jgi:MoaA/NifB/PqqE/SkfB family radical SAM enzyme
MQLTSIKAINMEISSRCVARCPFCSRRQKVRPYGNYDITLEDFKKLPASLLKQLRRISFAGNFGDFCSNEEFVSIVAYLKQLNPGIAMDGDTNAATQNELWWRRLGALFGGNTLTFALDGLEDTHALHRRGTRFSTVLRNVTAFASGGGSAWWKFIVFEHNEHQIAAAAALAEEIGCAGFMAMASRDYDQDCRRPLTLDVKIKREVYHTQLQHIGTKGDAVRCKPFLKGAIYIAADGTVHPCCFAHCMYITEHNAAFQEIVPLVERHYAEINFKTTPIEKILAGSYFKAVARLSPTNAYCRLKCAVDKARVRDEVVLYEQRFR